MCTCTKHVLNKFISKFVKMNSFFDLKLIKENIGNQIFIGKSGLFAIDTEFTQINTFLPNKNFQKIISGINFSSKKDLIRYIDLFNDNTFFILAAIQKMPYGVFLKINENSKSQEKFPTPNILSFNVNSLVFHKSIILAFVPNPNIVCIVSKEGISVHNFLLKPLYFCPKPVYKASYIDNYLIYSDGVTIHILSIDVNGEVSVVYKKVAQKSFPKAILNLSNYIILIFISSKFRLIQKIDKRNPKNSTMIQIENIIDLKIFSIDHLKFTTYDNLLIIGDNSSKKAVIFDIENDNPIQIGDIIDSETVIEKIMFDNICFSSSNGNNSLYKLALHYEAIKNPSPHAISALFRRTNALQTSINFFINLLNNKRDQKDIINAIDIIGPSATGAVQQIRFAQSIRYSSALLDPHIVVTALLRYFLILGDKVLDDTAKLLYESLSHSNCKYTCKNLFSSWNIKLNNKALKVLTQTFKSDDNLFIIEPENVKDILTFADICIDLGKENQAKKLILRHILDQSESELNDVDVISKFTDRFGYNPFQSI